MNPIPFIIFGICVLAFAIIIGYVYGGLRRILTNERFFLVSYHLITDAGAESVGYISFAIKGFPSFETIKDGIEATRGLSPSEREQVVITNIYEYKSKKDYDAFGEN